MLAGLIFLEAAAVAVAAISLVVEIVASTPSSYASAIALAALVALAAVLLAIVGVATVRARPWIRGAAICWQILQVLVAVSILQAQAPDVAWLLILPAAAIIILLFTRSVREATARPER